MSNNDEEDFYSEGLDEGSDYDEDDASDSSDGGSAGESNGDPSHYDAIEDGYDTASHGAGELESVPGFDLDHAMLEGVGDPQDQPVEQELWSLPRSCDLEFEQPETVCGADDRVHVTAVTRIPWRMICQLIITRADGRKSRCTGWFISPRTVMTAGHCVFSHTGGGWARSIEVIPGMNGSRRPFGSATGTSFRSVTGWTKKQKVTHDYGCIILPKNSPLGARTGWWGFAALSDKSLRNLLANNSGYPGDKPFGTQWYNAGRITKVTNRRLYYMFDTAGGQSGSPTWRYANNKRHAIGIHAYGGCPNKSTRINRAVFDNMKKWKSLGS